MELNRTRKFLVNARQKNRTSNAYIVYGGNKHEREETALFLSCLLNCPKIPPCMDCSLCKAIESRVYPDVKWIVPSKSVLSIDDVRNVKEDIYITPYAGSKKIYIFDINYMRDESANALLKILEEPPVHSVMLILSRNINFFLPTIVSRCQKLRLNYELPSDAEGFADAQKEFVLILEQLRKNRFYEFFKSVEALVKKSEREDVENWLEKVVYMYRVMYLGEHKVEGRLLLSTGIETGIPHGEGSAVRIIEDVMEIKERIRYNINLKLGIENLFLQINQMQQVHSK
ncbi:MAG TPA: hypothetical protein PKN36_00215 [bacterium]|nr:hypothetical protein [bacterium]